MLLYATVYFYISFALFGASALLGFCHNDNIAPSTK